MQIIQLLQKQIVIILLLMLNVISLVTYAEPVINQERNISLQWGVKIPMRDGVKLNATVYKPKNNEKLPVIFTLTPYIADNYHDRAMYFSKNGYVFVIVDARGRGNSEGLFKPFEQEPHDTHDVIEWLANAPWSNGKVAMWGGSYGGFNQWSALKEYSPHLITIVPAAAAYPGRDFPFLKNIFMPYNVQWLMYTNGVTGNTKLFNEQSFWIAQFRELYFNHLPFDSLDLISGNYSPLFHQWLSHPTPDVYWDDMSPNLKEYANIHIPILTITGIYDDDQIGALTYYREHMKYGSDSSKANHYLIIGPWDHAGTRTPTSEIGGLKFDDEALLDLNQLHKEWYDWTLKNGKKPNFLKNRVAYYIPGAERWNYAPSLESITQSRQLYYLHSDGKISDVFHSGVLDEKKPTMESADIYIYNPLDTRPGDFEKEEIKNTITDQRSVLNLFGNGVVYHTEPFPNPFIIAGNMKFIVWIAMDAPDTDFEAKVYEIHPDGTSIVLASDQIRARYNQSLRKEHWIAPGVITRFEFNHFQFFSRAIAKGSRLRLVLKCPNSIFTQKNYNTREIVSSESGKNSSIAHIQVYHDEQHASFLEVPIH